VRSSIRSSATSTWNVSPTCRKASDILGLKISGSNDLFSLLSKPKYPAMFLRHGTEQCLSVTVFLSFTYITKKSSTDCHLASATWSFEGRLHLQNRQHSEIFCSFSCNLIPLYFAALFHAYYLKSVASLTHIIISTCESNFRELFTASLC
jgi:hypothetical protein